MHSDDGTVGLTDRALDNIIAMTSQESLSPALSAAQPVHSTQNSSCLFPTQNTEHTMEDGDK